MCTSFCGVMAGLCLTVVTGCLGGEIGTDIGGYVYDKSKSNDEKKAYNDKRNKPIEKVRIALNEAEQHLRKCELELQHFNNNI